MTILLDGLRVVDFSELLPGPYLTQNLADLGADVIKVERPIGDPARAMAPGMFASVNRDKKEVRIDLKSDEGVATALQLVNDADVVVESFRPGVMARFGLGPEQLCKADVSLIYVSLSGYGATGTKSGWTGHDVTYAADSGVLALAGNPQRPPEWGPGVPVADLAASMFGLSALLAALHRRTRTGEGGHVDVSIRDCLSHWLNPRLGDFTVAGLKDPDQQRSAALTRAAYGVFRCSDGADIAVAALEEHFWSALVDTLALDAWSGHEWATAGARQKQADQINEAIAQVMAEHTSAQALSMLREAGVPVALVLNPEQAVEQTAVDRIVDGGTAGRLMRFPVGVRTF